MTAVAATTHMIRISLRVSVFIFSFLGEAFTYEEVYKANRRICERLGVEEDKEVELTISNLINIGKHLSMKMYDYGVFFSSPSIK